MKKTLFLGSTVLDMILPLDHLPVSKEDINSSGMTIALGGCAFNAFFAYHWFSDSAFLCSPCGTGSWADLLKSKLAQHNVVPWIEIPDEDNGCCLCLVEKNGERTFISHHGAEYRFDPSWLHHIDMNTIERIYVCGIELEEPTGKLLLETLQNLVHCELFFVPGARVSSLKQDILEAMFQLKPILHLNEQEATFLTGLNSVEESAMKLQTMGASAIIITCGPQGAYCFQQSQGTWLTSPQVRVIDTIGAGDSHAGTVLAGLHLGLTLAESVNLANHMAAGVVSVQGAQLTLEQAEQIKSKISFPTIRNNA